MGKGCLLYYITDRTAFPGDESSRRRRLLEKICEAARAGVDYIQLREKDLPTRDLELLAKEAVSVIAQLKTENRELRTALCPSASPSFILIVCLYTVDGSVDLESGVSIFHAQAYIPT